MVTAIRAELKKALTDLDKCKKELRKHEEIPISEDKSLKTPDLSGIVPGEIFIDDPIENSEDHGKLAITSNDYEKISKRTEDLGITLGVPHSEEQSFATIMLENQELKNNLAEMTNARNVLAGKLGERLHPEGAENLIIERNELKSQLKFFEPKAIIEHNEKVAALELQIEAHRDVHAQDILTMESLKKTISAYGTDEFSKLVQNPEAITKLNEKVASLDLQLTNAIAAANEARKLLVEEQKKNFQIEAKNQNLHVQIKEANQDTNLALETRDLCRTEFNEFRGEVNQILQQLQELT